MDQRQLVEAVASLGGQDRLEYILANPAMFRALREHLWWSSTLFSPAGLKRLFPGLK